MKTANILTSACRYCRFYNPEGRRGGVCDQLGVPVQASWKACAFAASPFTSTWETIEEIVFLEKTLSLECSQECAASKFADCQELPQKTAVNV